MEIPLVLVSVAFVVWLVRILINQLTSKLPPGPWGLPLVGYRPFLTDALAENFIELQQKYGKIFGFWNGAHYTVVLEDFADMKEAFNKEEFLDRPSYFQNDDIDNSIISMNGWKWKETRRFVLTSLRNLGMGGNRVEEAIKDEITLVVEKLERKESSKEVNVYDVMYPPLLKIIFFLICGRVLEEDKILPQMEKYSESIFSGLNFALLKHFYPFLRPYIYIKTLLQTEKRKLESEIESFIWNQIASHEKVYDENCKDDFMDHYIGEMKKKADQETAITRKNLFGNSLGLLLAGMDTTRVTSTWTFLCLAQYQDKQAKVHAEIIDVLGKEKTPSWSDRDRLPYLNAFIMEVARVKTIAPAADPHCSSRDSTIGNFFIPKNTMIIGNILAVHRDASLWGDPQNFRPERFLSSDGQKIVQPEYWIPFMTGKRACPGEKLASMQLFMFVSSIVQKFKVVPPVSGLNSEGLENVLLYPVKPNVAFELRN